MLTDVMRDFKKFTSKKIIELINNEPESRREWLLDYFKKASEHLKKEQQYKVWQNGFHAEHIFSNKFIIILLKIKSLLFQKIIITVQQETMRV